MTGHPHSASIPGWISTDRFQPYVRAAGGSTDIACELYEWSVALSAAAFEAISYLEIISRNALDIQMQAYMSEKDRGIPWFLLPIVADSKVQTRIDHDVAQVRNRLRGENQRKETRGQVVAGLSFGFWAHLLGRPHEQLWRKSLHKAFPGSSGKRADVSTAMIALNRFRNRLAHHDSLLAVDVTFELTRMHDVLGWIDPGAAQWLSANERVTALQAKRPVARQDTVIVGAGKAWPLYQTAYAYVCQSGRTFQPVDYMAFYSNNQIYPEIPQILDRIDNVDWSEGEVHRLRGTGLPRDERLADIIEESRLQGWTDGRYQVFLLTRPGETHHLTLGQSIQHAGRGRGSAFTQRQRYATREALRQARTTSQL